jgi:hypothetical protein
MEVRYVTEGDSLQLIDFPRTPFGQVWVHKIAERIPRELEGEGGLIS